VDIHENKTDCEIWDLAADRTRGAITAGSTKAKAYPVYGDEPIALFEVVSLAAGMRGLHILLAPATYWQATGTRIGPIATAAS
jgi:Cys-tRNA(Pro)/Cys-tRNA(Cys) deacylase